MARDVIGSKEFLKYVPLLFSMFCLILVNNLFGIIPPVQFPTMSRIAFPAVLAIIVWVVFHVIGIRRKGFGGYFKSLVPGGLPAGMVPPIFLLEPDHRPVHPAGHARAATVRQHVRRPPAAGAVHHRRRVHADPRRHRAEGDRRRVLRHGLRDDALRACWSSSCRPTSSRCSQPSTSPAPSPTSTDRTPAPHERGGDRPPRRTRRKRSTWKATSRSSATASRPSAPASASA
nr:F0F1 ATP synthase subunit A [Angustibacter aerolatus]